MFGRRRSGIGLLGLLLPFVSAALPARATMLDPNWTETTWLATGVSSVTGMAWAPDGSGRLFLTQKEGQIRIVNFGPSPTLLAAPFATVSPIYTTSECGLDGIAFDPGFASNGWVYVFATVSSSEQQILRYRAVGDIGIEKTVLIAGLPTRGVNHDGGGIGFGPDGKLYFSIGDNGNGTGTNADLSVLAAKVSRANPDGSVPPDNPFADGPGGNNDYIWARGFRNPFTMTFQPATGALWVDVAGTNYEQVFVVAKADHAGWNTYENNQPAGYITPAVVYRTNSTDSRTIAATGATRTNNVATFTTTAAHGFRRGGKITIAGVTNTTFNGAFYVTSTPTTTTFTVDQVGVNATSGNGTATTQNLGGALTGGAFYDATGAPASYRGNFFFGDYNAGRINRVTVGPGTTVNSVDYFTTGNTSATDVSVGPDGALYYVGTGGTVLRARYNATAQGLVVSNTHIYMNEGQETAFSVSLAVAPSSTVVVEVKRKAGSSHVNVKSGARLTFTPADWSIPKTVVLASIDDGDVLNEATTFAVGSAGLTAEDVQVQSRDTSGSFGGLAPGGVPDGGAISGTPLTLGLHPGDPTLLDLSWGSSCGATWTDYSLQEGTLGRWYSHEPVLCSTEGASAATISPGADNRYYLVVPLDAQREGSYGLDSSGAEIPRSVVPCRTERDTTVCP